MQIFRQIIDRGGGGGPNALPTSVGAGISGVTVPSTQLILGPGVPDELTPHEPRAGGASTSATAERIISQKHDEYAAAAKRYRALYYLFRVIAGLTAGLLPFVIASQPNMQQAFQLPS